MSPLPLASNRPWFSLFFVSMSLAVAALALLSSSRKTRSHHQTLIQGNFYLVSSAWVLLVGLQFIFGVMELHEVTVSSTGIPDPFIEPEVRYLDWLPVSIAPSLTLYHLLLAINYFVLFFLTIYAVRNSRNAVWIIYIVCLSAALQCLIGIGEYFLSQDLTVGLTLGLNHSELPINGTFVNRNHFSGFVAIGCALSFGIIVDRFTRNEVFSKRQGRNLVIRFLNYFYASNFLHLALVSVGILTIGISGSRGALLSLCMGFIFCFGWVIVKSRDKRIYGLFVAIMMLILIFSLLDSLAIYRSSDFLIGGLSDGRTAEWAIAMKVVDGRPFAGFGLGTYTDAYNLYRDGSLMRDFTFDHAHNHYIELLVETGLSGFLLLGIFVFMALRLCINAYSANRSENTTNAAVAIVCATLTILIHALVEFSLKIPAIAMTFHIILGVGVALGTIRHRNGAPSKVI